MRICFLISKGTDGEFGAWTKRSMWIGMCLDINATRARELNAV